MRVCQRNRWWRFGQIEASHPVEQVSHDEATHIADILLVSGLCAHITEAFELAGVTIQEGRSLGERHELEVDTVCEAELLVRVDVYQCFVTRVIVIECPAVMIRSVNVP